MKKRRTYHKQKRIRRKKTLFKNKLFLFLFFFFSGMAAGFYFAVFSPEFQIKEIKIIGANKVAASDIESFLKEKISKNLLFIKTQGIFLLNPSAAAHSLLAQFPQIESVKIERILPISLAVDITERTAVGVWCQKDDCFLVDRNGIVFEQSNRESSLLIVSENRSSQPSLGEKVIEKELMASLLAIQKAVQNELKIGIKEITIPNSERVNLTTKDGWQIYFSQKNEIDWQLTKLRMVLEKEIPLIKRPELEYIDLRFGNLAPYRYKTNIPLEE